MKQFLEHTFVEMMANVHGSSEQCPLDQLSHSCCRDSVLAHDLILMAFNSICGCVESVDEVF